MRYTTLVCWALALVPMSGCRKQPPDGDTARKGALDKVTSNTMAAAARKDGFKVRSEVSERSELPGATVYRLTLDHRRKGTAFVDLYDLSTISTHPSEPVARIGPKKSIYVSVSGLGSTSADLLATLISNTQLDNLTRSAIEEGLRADGWVLGDSSNFKDDISGHQIIDVSADKDDADALVVLLDYTKVATGTQQSTMLLDGQRILFVDMEKSSWSKLLLNQLIK